ncbi:MAG: ABC transporter substrate-binding protein, partial [Cyanobacteria bacterium J06623_7]
MNKNKILGALGIFLLVFSLAIGCGSNSSLQSHLDRDHDETIVIGYSNWVGWWPWAIAEREGIFARNNIKVELKWYDSYSESMEAFAAGQLDGNCQTLNDTVSFAAAAVNGEVIVLVNDNSAGNDKIIVASEINRIEDLKQQKVALEAGVVSDFLLSLALESRGMKRTDLEIVDLETSAAVVAFTTKQTDVVGAFAPYWPIALERAGARELVSSADFPGSIPDLLVVSQKLIDEQPKIVL